MKQFALVVIGAGQGGLPAAALAARLGANVATAKTGWLNMSIRPP